MDESLKKQAEKSTKISKDSEDFNKEKKEVTKIKKNSENRLFNFDELSLKELTSVSTKKEKIDQGSFINEAMNNNMSSFIPDLLAKNITKNYRNAKQIYGEKIIKYLTGYSSEYIDRNIKIPEFQKEIKKKIQDKIEKLKKENILDKNNELTKKSRELAIASELFIELEKLDKMMESDTFGKYVHQYKADIHGAEKSDTRKYRKGDSYKDIALKSSIKLAIRRKHNKLEINDLKTFERSSKANLSIVYAIDASSSMKGQKLEAARKSAISLAYKTISDKNKLGIINFSDKINDSVFTTNFEEAINFIYDIVPNAQTDIEKAILHSVSMFPSDSNVKHLILLTDAMPTKSEDNDPEQATLNAVGVAKASNISVSIVLIEQKDLKESKILEFASKIVEAGDGKLYKIRNLEELDALVIDDYNSLV